MSAPTSRSIRYQSNGRQRWMPSLQRPRRFIRTIRTKSYFSLSKEQKKQRQDAIVEKERQAAELKKQYFGPEGELFKKRTALMSPIQEEIYSAIKDIADLRGYQLVLDRASDSGIIFGSPKIDISSEVLRKLGY